MLLQIQRLGIAHHFDREIKESLEQVYLRFLNSGGARSDDDLHATGLQFRLLRQHGYRIPTSVFDKFTNREGNFHASLINDVKGLLSLYEASHFRVRGEETLEEALNFCISHLKPMEDKYLEVSHALKQCLHRGAPRLEARRYMERYQNDDSRDEVLLNLAKLDFNWTQKQHQREISEITRWWKDLDFRTKLPFARDRIVECYFWILGVYFEPEYSFTRAILTKALTLISIVDDIYDVYGTAEERQLFMAAIERWDVNAIGELPGYLQACYSAILDMYREIEGPLAEQGRSYCLYYAIEAIKITIRGYYEESRWLLHHHIPTVEEYMDVALVSSSYRSLAITALVGMQDISTKDIFEWLLSDPKIVKASATVLRLMDDITSHKFEQQRVHIPSAVECYMKQCGVEEQEAEDVLRKRVDDAWKDMNEECLYLTEVPPRVLQGIFNLARMADVMYKGGDRYTSSSKLKDFIYSLLIHPIAG